MSVPHTGRLTARIDDVECKFDGNQWLTPSLDLTTALNQATATSPTTHFDIRHLAQHILSKAGFNGRYQIVSFQADQWDDDLPDGAID